MQGTSRQEIEVYNFIKMSLPNVKVEKNNRTILKGKELDIYIPSKKLAVEFNGLFFHNDAKKSDPFYHLEKTINCERKGIRLIQIMSDEWEQKKPLVLELIRQNIGIYEHFDAGRCELRVLTESEGKGFFENNHLLGNDKRSSVYIGLLFERQVVYCASFAKEKTNWILTRFGSRKGYKIFNALKTILDYFLKEHSLPITASIDRRLYFPDELKECGFKEVQPTNPNVTITKDFKKRIPIGNMKKLTESDLEKKGYCKVYDCGERRFLKE